MPNFAANLTFLWTEYPFLDRFEHAAHAGFRGVEFHFPYDDDAADIKARLDTFQLTPVLHNLSVGNIKQGEFGLACLPGREADFRLSVEAAIDYAKKLGTPRCNCLVGKVAENADDAYRQEAESVLIKNLIHAGHAFAKAKLELMIEPLNHIDTPDFFLTTAAETIVILDKVGLGNIKLQYDFYHRHMMGENIAGDLPKLLPRIGHIQFADAPGRHEPAVLATAGSINFAALFAQVDALNYRGWVAAEYKPSGLTKDSFGWLSS
jgi:hydroxypyruvate isomerase